MVSSRLGKNLFPSPLDLSISSPDDANIQAALRTTDGGDTGKWTSEAHCLDLIQALTLVVSLFLNYSVFLCLSFLTCKTGKQQYTPHRACEAKMGYFLQRAQKKWLVYNKYSLTLEGLECPVKEFL